MNRNRLMVGLAFAVLLAFVLAAYVYHAFKKVQVSAAAPAMRMTTIVVAAEPLKIGERLDASKVRTIQWPSGSKPAGMFGDISEVANRAVITNLAENEPILADNLASSDSGGGLSATIPEGMRAVSVLGQRCRWCRRLRNSRHYGRRSRHGEHHRCRRWHLRHSHDPRKYPRPRGGPENGPGPRRQT